MKQNCERAEVLAGAIALGEATDHERDEYRRHIAACTSCLGVLGGEREIERTMSFVQEARESERWEPAISSLQRTRNRSVQRWWRFGASLVTVALAISIGLHAMLAASIGRMAPTPSDPITINYDGQHITLEQRPRPQRVAKVKNDEPRMVVVHNVITLKAPVASHAGVSANSESKPVANGTTVVASAPNAAAISAAAQPRSVPMQQTTHDTIGGTSPAATVAETGPSLEGHAESIALAPSYSVRDVVPVGGETAINPQPAAIAYSEGAEGTSVFEVSVDEHGAPTKCTITKSSGFLVLDEAVCRAAMKARYSPRMVNGHATSGIYRDAFTFRAQSNTEGVN